MGRKLYASEIKVMLNSLDDAARCYGNELQAAGDNYLNLVRRYLLDASLSDVAIEPIKVTEDIS